MREWSSIRLWSTHEQLFLTVTLCLFLSVPYARMRVNCSLVHGWGTGTAGGTDENMWKRHAMEDLEPRQTFWCNLAFSWGAPAAPRKIPRARRAKLGISWKATREMKRKRAKVKPRLSCRFKMILGCLVTAMKTAKVAFVFREPPAISAPRPVWRIARKAMRARPSAIWGPIPCSFVSRRSLQTHVRARQMEPSVRTETPAPFFRNAWMENALEGRASSVRTTIRAPSESATPNTDAPSIRWTAVLARMRMYVRSEEFARRESASAQTK